MAYCCFLETPVLSRCRLYGLLLNHILLTIIFCSNSFSRINSQFIKYTSRWYAILPIIIPILNNSPSLICVTLSSLSKHAMTAVQCLKTLANKGVFVLCHVCPFCHGIMGKFRNTTIVVLYIYNNNYLF